MSPGGQAAVSGIVLGVVLVLLLQQFGPLSLSSLSMGLLALIIGGVIGGLAGGAIGARLGRTRSSKAPPAD